MGICKLCHKEKELKLSHIFPRFIVVWLRNTGTGNFRNPQFPNRREQDGPKKYMLCHDCENQLSISENYFRQNVFYPIINSNIEKITITQQIVDFVISILWRILINELEYIKDNMYYEEIVAAEKEWRNYLYNKQDLCEFNKLHLIITSELIDDKFNEIPNFNRYLTRDLDGTLVSSSTIAFQYAKFSRFTIVGEICKSNPKLFSGTDLIMGSTIESQNQEVINDGFTEFLVNRVRLGNKLYDDNLSENQQKKILNSIESKQIKRELDYFRSIQEYLKSNTNA